MRERLKMRLAIFLLLLFTLHTALSAKPKRPTNFTKRVKDLLKQMAVENEYKKFDKCHIVPWDFMADMIDQYERRKRTKKEMTTFIDHLAMIHKDASFYKKLDAGTREKLENLRKDSQDIAKKALGSGNMKMLAQALFNIPSNLYPGYLSNNRGIRNRFDPPKKELNTVRTDDATNIAKALYAKYHPYGLTMYPDPKNPNRAKSSDTPPNDNSGAYVTIA